MSKAYCNYCAGIGKHEDSCKMIGIPICVACEKPIAKGTPRTTIHREGYSHKACA